MAFKIKDTCVGCGACFSACPAQAIFLEGGRAKIDTAKCIACGACSEFCPVDAPEEE